MRAYVESYGCSHNESDARIIRALLEKSGATLVDKPESADYLLLNTCGVKHTTELKMLSRARELAKCKGMLFICGCLPAINEAAVRKAAPNAVLVGTDCIGELPQLLTHPRDCLTGGRVNKLALARPKHGLTAVIQIGEGCTGSCTFCGTRHARGSVHSYPLRDIVASVEAAVRGGAREVYLTAEDTGCYGLDAGSSLPELINAVAAVPGDFKIRVGMMNPDHALRMLPQLLAAFKNEKVYRFVHLPVQSGSDAVLRAMRRNYSVADFERVVAAFRKSLSGVAVSTDVIVAFPTETEQDFRATMALLGRVRPDIANVSRFGPRPRTPAAAIKQLSSVISKRRSAEAGALAKALSLESSKRLVGQELETVALSRGSRGGVIGRAPNYRQLVFDGSLGVPCRVRVARAFPYYLRAERLK